MRWFLWELFILFSSLAGAQSNGICTDLDEESILQRGHEYSYHLRADVTSEMLGTGNDKSRLAVGCNVSVTHSHVCFYTLMLNCSYASIDQNHEEPGPFYNEYQTWLSRYPVMFALNNGVIKHVYSHPDDPLFCVNFKKGILSIFVFKLSLAIEERKDFSDDIHGSCFLTSIPANGTRKVKTHKDLSQCTLPYEPNLLSHDWSLLSNENFITHFVNSTAVCEYDINSLERKIEEVQCEEKYSVKMHFFQETAVHAKTAIHYKMEHLKTTKLTKAIRRELPKRKTSIAYSDFPFTANSSADLLATAKKLLEDLVQMSENEIKLSSIRCFNTFVDLLKTSDDLMPFTKSVLECSGFSNEICPLQKGLAVSYLSDGLLACNTVPCMEAMSYLAMKNILSDAYLNFVLYYWSSMDHHKEQIANNVMDICRLKKSRFCWLTLGTLVRKFVTKKTSKLQISPAIKNIASYYGYEVNSTCEACTSSSTHFSSVEKHYNHLYTFIKGIGNMGELYATLGTDGLMPLLSCLRSKRLPLYQKTAILETLKKLNVCSNSEMCKVIHKKLFPILVQQNEHVELRVHVFELLMSHPEEFNLVSIIVKLLTEDQNSQIKALIASSLEFRMQDQSYSKEHCQFIDDLQSKLKDHKIQLNHFYEGRKHKSSNFAHGGTFKFPFLPQEINEFGMKLDTLTFYRIYSMIPHFLRSNITMHLFSKIVHIAQLGVHFEDFEDLGKIFLKLFHDISTNSLDLGKLGSVFMEIFSSLNSEKPDHELNSHLDETVINNIKKVHRIYKSYNRGTFPFFHSYLDMFGDTLNFMSLNDILKFIFEMKEVHEMFSYLHEGIAFSASRTISLIGAQHQVPTILGLPLAWASDVFLGFSVHSNLKMDFSQQSKSQWYNNMIFQLRPSAALTFVNRMVLGTPNVVQVGVQMNSSCYSSTQWKVRHFHSGSNEIWKLDIEKPQKSQTLLKFLHKNELIKHNSYEDVSSCDENSSEWCFDDEVSSVIGIKGCLEASNMNAFPKCFLGCCKLGIYIHPHDSTLKTYTLEKSKKNDSSRDESSFKFHTPGSAHKREVIVSLSSDKSNMENSLNLKVPGLPNFSAFLSSKGFLNKNGSFGCEIQAAFQLSEDIKYQLIYNENSRENSSEVEFEKKMAAPINENALLIMTPFNLYTLTKYTSIRGGSNHQIITASYSNLVSGWNWLSRILPVDFWETNSKAWIQVDFGSRKSVLQKDEISSHSTSGYLKSPHVLIEFSLNSFKEPGKEQTHFNMKRVKSDSLELATFLNFTYNFWSSRSEELKRKELQVFNVTVPHRSWSTEILNIINQGKILYNITFTRAIMTSKDSVSYDYVGWWNNDVIDKFEFQEWKYRFKMELDDKFLHESQSVSASCGSGDGNIPSFHKLTNFDIGFYLDGEGEEPVTCHGMCLISTGLDLFRFQIDFALHISRMNLKLDSSSLYQVHKGVSEISHKDIFTYEKTDTKAFYNLFAQFNKVGDCNHVDFNHNISSYIVDFSSNVSYHCKPDDPKLHVLLLNIDSTSAIWNTLNSELRQIVDDVSHEYSEETMNYSTPLMIINVTADWKGIHHDHTKRAVFTSLWNQVPSFAINFESMMDGHRTLQIDFDDEKETKIVFKTQYIKELKGFQAEMIYADVESNQDWIPFISFNSRIQDTGEKIWAAEINRTSLQNVALFWENAFLKAGEILASISSEPSHPINEILKPVLRATLSEYYRSLKSQMETAFYLMLQETGKVAKALEPFYIPVFSVISNLLHEIKAATSYLNLFIKDKFETALSDPGLLGCLLSKLQHYVTAESFSIVNYTHVNHHITTFKFRSFPLFQLYELSMAFLPMSSDVDNLVSLHEKVPQQFYTKTPGNKIAMMFGHAQIYTFDGVLYELPDSPPKCVFLLSHDVQKSAFSVSASADSLYILFPEITISINSKNEVHINGNEKQQNCLPIEAGNGKVLIRREGEIVFVQSPSLSVMCDGRNSIYALEISGWNSDHVVGILGNADGESYNDYMLPDGKIAKHIFEFAAAYELSGQQECKAMNVPVKSKEELDLTKICRNLTYNHCSIAKGLQHTFQDTCEKDSDKCNERYISSTSKGLDAICYLEGFGQEIPSNCQVNKLEHTKHKLEVVLLVNEHSTMNMEGHLCESIAKVLEVLEEKFHTENYFDIQYSLVGFGGKGVRYKPSIHTVAGDIWVPYSVAVDQLLKTLKFHGMDHLNPVTPIKYAAELLGYDTFGSKIFILFTNKDEQQTDQEMVESSVEHLLKNGITLYTFATYRTVEKEPVFGIRSDGSFLPLSKAVDVLHLNIPNGDVENITFMTGGAVFLKGAHGGNSPSEYYLEFAEEVWKNVKKEELLCRNCKEVRGMWWNDYQECAIQHC